MNGSDVLVTGATGYIGGLLVPVLIERGRKVRCLSRDPQRLHDKPWFGQVEHADGDALRQGSLDRALAGINTAYYLIHSMSHSGGYATLDRRAALNFAKACTQANVERIIFLGALGDPERRLSKHLRSRQDTGAALRSGKAKVTELRAAQIIGWNSASFQIIREVIELLPVIPAPPEIRTRAQPIAEADVLQYLARCLDQPATADDIFEIGGPEVLTYKQLLEQFGEAIGRPVLVLEVPVLPATLAANLVSLVTPRHPRSLSEALMLGLGSEVVVEDNRICDLIPFVRTRFHEAVRQAYRSGGRSMV